MPTFYFLVNIIDIFIIYYLSARVQIVKKYSQVVILVLAALLTRIMMTREEDCPDSPPTICVISFH